MKVVFLAWRDLANPLAGGSEVLIDRLASGLVARGHEAILVAGAPVDARPYEVVDAGGRYAQYLRAPAIVEHRHRDADLVVDVANGMSYMTPLWRRRPSMCLVNHVHTDQWALWFNPAMATVGRTIERHVTPRLYRDRMFIAVSPSTAAALAAIGVDPEHIRVVPNGVDLAAPSAPKSTEPIFVALGRLVPHKRIDLLLETWERVRPRTGGRLVIVGDGPERPRLQTMAGAGVEFAGYVDEATKQRLLSEAWMLIHPSMLEGWGLVITEAGAVGTPTIGFEAPGVRDAVVHGESGLLARDEIELADMWAGVATDWRLRTALSLGARRRANQFSWDNTVDRFVAVAAEAITRHHVPTAPVVAEPHPVAVAPSLSRRTTLRDLQPHVDVPKVSIVVPAFNEARRLPETLPRLVEVASNLDCELIVVDDGSTDNTAELAADLMRRVRRPVLLRLPENRGKGAAVRAGVAQANGDQIVFMDADLATDLDDLDHLLVALGDAHVAVGSRAVLGGVVTGASEPRKIMGRVFNRWARGITGLGVGDFRCGFKAFRAPAAKVLFGLAQVDGFAFDVEVLGLAGRIGYRTVEVPVRWHNVAGGHVRPVREAPVMAASMVRSRLRWTGYRTLAAIRAARVGHQDGAAAIEALTGLVPGRGPIVPWHDGVLALLPFTDDAAAARLAAVAQRDLPEFDVHNGRLGARELLAPTAVELRNAIAAA